MPPFLASLLCPGGGSQLRTLSLFCETHDHIPLWPPEPGDLQVFPRWQPQKLGFQFRVQASFQDIPANWSKAEGDNKDGTCLPLSLESISVGP